MINQFMFMMVAALAFSANVASAGEKLSCSNGIEITRLGSKLTAEISPNWLGGQPDTSEAKWRPGKNQMEEVYSFDGPTAQFLDCNNNAGHNLTAYYYTHYQLVINQADPSLTYISTTEMVKRIPGCLMTEALKVFYPHKPERTESNWVNCH